MVLVGRKWRWRTFFAAASKFAVFFAAAASFASACVACSAARFVDLSPAAFSFAAASFAVAAAAAASFAADAAAAFSAAAFASVARPGGMRPGAICRLAPAGLIPAGGLSRWSAAVAAAAPPGKSRPVDVEIGAGVGGNGGDIEDGRETVRVGAGPGGSGGRVGREFAVPVCGGCWLRPAAGDGAAVLRGASARWAVGLAIPGGRSMSCVLSCLCRCIPPRARADGGLPC